MTTSLWASDTAWLAHLIGIVGLSLMALSMLYSLRKRKWLVTFGPMKLWLSLHHWAGLIGGVLVLAHTLGSVEGIGLLLVGLVLLVLASSGLFFLEVRGRRPLNEATFQLAGARRERTRLDAAYRDLYARGLAPTPQGVALYRGILAENQRVQGIEARVAQLREAGPGWTWWRDLHNVGTMLLFGVVIAHVWMKIYFGGGSL